jgi:hypothetical protein
MRTLPEVGMRFRLRNRVGTIDGISWSSWTISRFETLDYMEITWDDGGSDTLGPNEPDDLRFSMTEPYVPERYKIHQMVDYDS